MRRATLAGLLAAVVVSAWLGAASLAAEPLAERTWDVEGVSRKALLYIPPTAQQKAAPVVFAFHGHGGSSNNVARSFNYQTHWPEAITVYMQGLNTPGKLTDPEGKLPGWQAAAGDQGDRDLKFFDAVLASLKTDYKVDERRIYCTGHSNGGGFTYLLWGQRGDVFAAVAPSAAVPSRGRIADLKPKPVMHVAGETDTLVKYEWQELAIAAIKRLNACDPEGTPWATSGTLVGTRFTSKSGPPLVTLIWPGAHKFPPEAPPLIVRFFKEHAKD